MAEHEASKVDEDRLRLIGTCHTCRKRGETECRFPGAARKYPERGCSEWAKEAK